MPHASRPRESIRLALTAVLFVLCGCGRSEPVRYHGFSIDPELVPPPDAGHVEPVDAGPPPCTLVRTDQYTVPPFTRRAIDVLFVIDDSCSMADDQQRLALNMASFFSAFTAAQVGYHVGVITTDMFAADRRGRLVAPFVTDQTPNARQTFENQVLVGIDGSGDERGLAALRASLRPPLVDGANKGFIRPDADFGVVIVADEDDHASLTVQSVVDTVRSVKNDPGGITVGSILLDCTEDVEQWRYGQFTRSFGDRGLISKCTQNYASTLRTIAGRVVNKQCIVALREPLVMNKQISVTLNGAQTDYHAAPPEPAFPNGSIEAVPCPESGGLLEISWSLCD
ncbi:MAG: hypothetical protein U0228_14680 [Myxococcaceae bacterium]